MRNGTTLVAAVLVTVLVASCGSSTLSHGDFVKQANAICGAYRGEVTKVKTPATLSETEVYARRVLVVYRAALAKLEALKPPKEDEVTVQTWIATDKRIESDIEAIAAAAKERRIPAVRAATERAALDNQASDRLASQLGLTVCAKA
jgi:protein-tyrosine-phosphatase